MQAMRRYPLDFIQVNYSIANRNAADAILPLAQERKMAVMVNVPFGGVGNTEGTFGRVKGRALPDWAAEIDAESWAQVFLKYVVSHPAVTVAIPGTPRCESVTIRVPAGTPSRRGHAAGNGAVLGRAVTDPTLHGAGKSILRLGRSGPLILAIQLCRLRLMSSRNHCGSSLILGLFPESAVRKY